MSKVAFKQADVARFVRGAIAGGWPVDKCELSVKDGALSILPIGAAAASDADDCERRMREAFGEDDGPDAVRR